MRIVFFGTSEFAMTVLRKLIGSKHEVVALVTQPDRQRGRHLKVSPPQTKVLASLHNIAVYQPDDASSKESVEYLKKFDADLFVVVAFGQILKKEILEIPKIYAVNIHSSILPKYRGAAPTSWAIMNGDSVTGVTIIKMNEKMDEGDIILAENVLIDAGDTNITLNEKLADVGSDMLIKAIESIEGGSVKLVKQDNRYATYAPKLKKEDGLINWDEPAVKNHNKVRALLPWPSAYTYFDGKVLKILNTEIVRDISESGLNGEIVDIIKHKGILIKTGLGGLLVKYVQIESKKPFDTDALLCGHKIPIGFRFGA